ncbi:MAG TPA: hypothetical protein VF721_21990 [Pyrinomonadaceae bacterium]|jgi:hypothetical protein
MSDNFQKYKGTLQNLSRRAKDNCWTPGFATLFYMLVGLLAATIIARVFFCSFGNLLIDFFVFLAEAVVILALILRYQRKTVEFMRGEVLELESSNPGIGEAFEEWQQRFKDSIPDGYQ